MARRPLRNETVPGFSSASTDSDLAMGGRLEVYLDGLRLNFDVFGTDGGFQIGDGLVVIPAGLGHDTGAHITVKYDRQPVADFVVGEAP